MRWSGWVVVGALWACGTSGTLATVTNPDGGSPAILPVSDAGTPADGGAQADAGPADAGPPADCIGLIPTKTGAAYTFDVPGASGMTCTAATSDGSGRLIAEAHDAGTSPAPDDQVTWNVFGANGAWLGNFRGGYDIVPQPTGFEGYANGWDTFWNRDGVQGNFAIVESGAVIEKAFGAGNIAIGADPSGVVVHRIDANGNEAERASAPVSGTPLSGADDASGAVLAVVGSGGVARGVWFDLTRATAGAAFDLGPATTAMARALIGGGVAVALDGHWSALLQPGDATLHPPPAWLEDGKDFAIVRGAKAYALIAPQSNAFDIVSAAGSTCGPATFPGVSSVAVGADGTVIGSSGAGGCTKVFWTGALK